MFRLFVVLVLLAAAALAGCAAPAGDGDELIGVCPHWSARSGPIPATAEVPAGGNVTHDWVPRDQATGEPRLTHQNWTFDRILVEVQSVTVASSDNGTGRLTLSAHAGERALLLYEHGVEERPRSLPTAVFTSDQARTFDVYLAPVDEAATWEPMPVTLTWRSEVPATATYQVTLFDRVCGVP